MLQRGQQSPESGQHSKCSSSFASEPAPVRAGPEACHIRIMSDRIGGHIIRVTTKQLGGGEPLVELFYVAEPNPAKAKQIVRIAKGTGYEIPIDVVGGLTFSEIKTLGLEPGEHQAARS